MDSKKTVSVSEFKNWLTGVLDFQPDNWTPNLEQWKKILDKIQSLEELSAPETKQVDVKPVTQPKTRPVGPIIEKKEAGVEPSLTDQKVKLPDLPPKERHVTVEKRPPSVIGDGKEKVIDTGEVHKMGTIDTTDGQYRSTFV